MSPKKVSVKYSVNKKKNIIMVELKKEIIENHERGVRVVDLTTQ